MLRTSKQKNEEWHLTAGKLNQLLDRFDKDKRLEAAEAEFDMQIVRLTMKLWSGSKLYVCATPWIRGWSVFVSNSPDEYDYSNVASTYKGLAQPVHNRRGVIGPWNTDLSVLYDAVNAKIEAISKLSQAQRTRYMLEHWARELFARVWSSNQDRAHLPYD